MDKLLNGIKDQLNVTHTENGAVAYKSTKNAIVDLFAHIGAMRQRSDRDIIDAFKKAYAEEPLVTLKVVFYARDVRGGLGERRTFRVIMKYLAQQQPAVVMANLDNFIEFGRYDDLLELLGTPVENAVIALIKAQLEEDMATQYPTLLAKWLPSANTSSKETRRKAGIIRKKLGISYPQYQRMLSSLRAKLRIVERYMSAKEWDKIDYSKVPSKAAMQYRQAFLRNDQERYEAYLEELKKPVTLRSNAVKVNADTLFPYDIVRKIFNETDFGCNKGTESAFKSLYNAQWDALPNYMDEDFDYGLTMVDTSGSMSFDGGLPLYSAVALGVYGAQHNKGRFHNYFMTFDTTPSLVEIEHDNIWDIIEHMECINVGSTNIEKAFDLVLDVAIEEKLTQEELPNRITIITDMEFDLAAGGYRYASKKFDKKSLMRKIRDKFEKAGYEMPKLVFWNVNARNAQFPMTMDDNGIQFVSGHSQSIFEAVAKGEMLDPYQLVLAMVNKPRYETVVLSK